MNCEEASQRMIEAVYGELPAQLQASFQEHLGGCSDCRLTYERLAQTDKLLDLVSDGTAQVDLSRLYRAAAVRNRQSSTRWRRLAVAAAALLIVAGALAVWRGQIEVGPDRLVISWRGATERPADEDSAAALADHARHLATLDETISLLVAELDASEQKRLELLTALQGQIQALQRRNSTRIDLVQQDIRDLYLASFSSAPKESGGQP
jgi:Putative zinc-finger